MVLGDKQLLVPPGSTEGPNNEPRSPTDTTNASTDAEFGTASNREEPSATDSRVSWIYKLRKEELDRELQRFRLDLSGTVEDKKKRLIMFMRHGLPSPQPPRGPAPFAFPPPPPPIPVTTAAHAPMTMHLTPLDPFSVHKWNVHFNGKGDPAAFIERLDEVCAYANLDHNQLLPVLPELLQGTPLLWYRNNKRFWKTWTDFIRDFRTVYFPVNYLEDLEAEIGRRLQQANESVAAYLTDLQTLIRRHGDMTPEQELRWLYRNLLPDYRQYIKKTDFTDVPSLTAKAKEFEALRKEIQEMYSSKPYRTETATRLPDRATPSSNSATAGARPMQAPRLSAPEATVRPQRPPTTLPPQPSTSRQTTEVGNQVPAPRRSTTVPSNSICWRCGETGHIRMQCRSRPKLFCSRCGREGTMTRDCNCRQPEN